MDYTPPPVPAEQTPLSNKPPSLDEVVWNTRKKFVDLMRRQDPDDPRWASESGQVYCLQGNYRACFTETQKAVEGGMADAETLTTYGSAAHNLGDNKLASEAAGRALEADPEYAPAHSLKMLSQGRVSTVKLPSSLGAAASASESWAGGSASGAGDIAEAGASGTYAAANPGYALGSGSPRPGNPAAGGLAPGVQKSASLTREASSALSVRDYTLAHSLASKAIDLNPENAQAWNYRAIADNKLERYSDAVHDASRSLQLAPGNTPALQSRSWALNRQQRFKEGLADANATLELEPENAFAYQNRAFAMAGMGDREEVLAALKRSAEIDPRFKDRYQKALQVPEKNDLLFLFDENTGAQTAAAPSGAPPPKKKRFMNTVVFAMSGGLLVAMGLLHIVSAGFRDKVRSTVRRVLGSSAGGAAAAEGGAQASGLWSQYEMVREIGTGGMGVVYEGRDTALDRPVAIKRMRDEIRMDPRERARFVLEARTVASLHHPNIADIYAIVEESDGVYLVFEYVKGRTLHDLIGEKGSLSFEAARKILRNACDAVEYAHRQRIIHRDLKPSNIMITDEGAAKVMDFGVARQAKDAMTKMALTNTVVGTPPYMAPEQEQGTVRTESDVYALGIVFYETLCGQLPFAGNGAGMLLNKMNGKYTPLTQVAKVSLPPGIDQVMAKVLTPDPDKRYRTPAEFASAVEALGMAPLV